MQRQIRRGFVLTGALVTLAFLSFSDTARAQSVTVTPNVLNFTGSANQLVNACNGGSDCKVHVTGVGVGTVQVLVSSLSPWVKVSPVAVNLPGDLNVSVDTTSLNAGTSTGTFIVYSSSNSTINQTVTVNVNVTNTSQLSTTPTSLTFNAQVGANSGTPQGCPVQNSPASCQITVQTTSATPITYNISATTQDGKQWLQPDAASGRTDGSPFNVAVVPQLIGNNPGVYHGSIMIQSTTNPADTVTVAVTLNVNATPTLSVDHTSLTYYFQIGQAVPPQQTVTVSATGGPTQFSVSQSAGSTWLGLSAIQGTASPTASVPINVSVSPGSLGVGKYTATLTIAPSAGGQSQTVNVTLFVSVNPFLTAPTTQLSFNAPFGGVAPSTQNVVIGSTGATALNFTASASSDQNWLTVSPSSGTTGQPSGTIAAGVNQSVLSTLGVGTYNGTIVISPTNGDQYNVQITATLTVGAASQISAAPQSLYFSFQIGQSVPAAQTVNLMASGPPVSFTVAPALNAANPASCGTGNWLGAVAQNSPLTTPNALTVTVNPTGMTAGICTGTVKVMYTGLNGATELDIPVTLFVATTPLLNIGLPQGFGIEATTIGGSNISRSLAMTSTDGTTAINYSVNFSADAPCQWLFAAPLSGTTPTPLQVSIQPGCITNAGSYPGHITITSSNLPQAVTLPITLMVTSNVQVAVTPQALNFTQSQGGPLPDPQKLNFTVSGGNAPFIATASTDLGNWLKVDPGSGNTSAGSVTVSIIANNLPVSPTPYNGRITLTFQNAATPSAVIPVKYTVNPAQTLSVTPAGPLTFSYQLQSGTAPAPQTLNVSSTGGAVNFTVAANSTGGWLSVDTTTGATPANGNPKPISVSVDPTKFQSPVAGTPQQGSIVISAPGVLANPITVNVTVNITAAAVPTATLVLNSASNNANAIAPGELITIKGTNLGPASPANGTVFTVNADGTVSSTLAGVQVTFNNIAGIPTYVSATQINVIVPWEINGLTNVNMVVSFNGGNSAPVGLSVAQTAPAIYTQNAQGTGNAAAINLSGGPSVSPYNGPAGQTYPGTNLALAPAAPGSYVSFFLTGCGQTSPPSTTGTINSGTQLAPLRNWTHGSDVVKATIGGVASPDVQFAGAAPTLISGICQVNLQVPQNVAGNALPVKITINGTDTLGSATIAVQ